MIYGADTGADFKSMITQITEACQTMNNKYRGQFIPDESNSRITVRMPYYSATIRVRPYTYKDKIIAVLRKCAKANADRAEKERQRLQDKLF